jgi:hypothetical protein
MWAPSYARRLQDWNLLRQRCRQEPLDQALLAVNDWWYGAPEAVRTIIWEDHEHWPDPWQLLAENQCCDLARALGMLYTVIMIEHPDCDNPQLCQTKHDNLVLVDQGKYILNWQPGQVLNIPSQAQQVRRQLSGTVFHAVTR